MLFKRKRHTLEDDDCYTALVTGVYTKESIRLLQANIMTALLAKKDLGVKSPRYLTTFVIKYKGLPQFSFDLDKEPWVSTPGSKFFY